MKIFRKDERVAKELLSSSALTAIVIAVVLAANAIMYVLTLFLGLYFAPAERDELVLSGATDSLFAEAIRDEKKVKISFCYPEEDVKHHDTGSYVYRTVSDFKERYPEFIELEFINLVTKRDSHGNLVDFSKYKTTLADGTEEALAINRATVIFECGNNYKVVTDASSVGYANFFTLDSTGAAVAYNGEEYVASMINWVIEDEHKTVYFTVNHSEQFDFSFASLLEAAGYYIDVIDLRKDTVPDDAAFVIVSNPKSDFETAPEGSNVHTEIERLEEYLLGGGRLFVTVDPYVKKLSVLEGFLAKYGISVSRTVDNGKLADIVNDPLDSIMTDGFTLLTSLADNELGNKISAKVESFTDGGIVLREVAALNLTGSAKPLLLSGESSVCENSGVVTRDEGSFAVAAYNEFKTQSGATARVAVVPSIYLAVSDALITNGYANKEFIFSLFEEFYGAINPPYGCNTVLYETETLENLTMGTAYTYTAVVLAVPTALAVLGTVIIIRRKNR